MRTARLCGHSFLPDLLGSAPVVVDAGFNHGEFSLAMIENYNATVFAVEPASKLFELRPLHPRLHLFKLALAGENGERSLHINETRCASLLATNSIDETDDGREHDEMVSVYTLGRFLCEAGVEHADLLKLDIEGAEIDLVETATDEELRAFNQITVEFHDFLWPDLAASVGVVKRRMENAGFRRINFSLDNTDVLFVRSESLSALTWIWVRFVVRNWMGMRRRLARWHLMSIFGRRRLARWGKPANHVVDRERTSSSGSTQASLP